MRAAKRLLRFAGVGALGAAVQFATVCALVQYAGAGPMTATTVAVATAVVHNFAWHMRATWNDRAPRAAAAFARFVLANGVVSLAGNDAIVWIFTRSPRVDAPAANAIAIVMCAVANYQLANRLVFR